MLFILFFTKKLNHFYIHKGISLIYQKLIVMKDYNEAYYYDTIYLDNWNIIEVELQLDKIVSEMYNTQVSTLEKVIQNK